MAKQKFTSARGIVKFPGVRGNRFKFALSFDPKDPEFLAYKEALLKAEDDFEKKFRAKEFIKEDADFDRDTQKKTPNGRVLIHYGWTTKFADKETGELIANTPLFSDANADKIDPINLWWGSECRVACTLRQYDVDGKVGLTRDVVGVQILKLTEGGSSPESCGFKKEEGYVKEEEKNPWDNEEELV